MDIETTLTAMEIWEYYISYHRGDGPVDQAIKNIGVAEMRDHIAEFSQMFTPYHGDDNFDVPWDWEVLPAFLDTIIRETGKADPAEWSEAVVAHVYGRVRYQYGAFQL